MQVIDRVKTFFAVMTKNDVEIVDQENLDKVVEKIRAQETGNIKKMEQEISKVNIPLEEKTTKKVRIDEKKALEEAKKKAQTKQRGEIQRGE